MISKIKVMNSIKKNSNISNVNSHLTYKIITIENKVNDIIILDSQNKKILKEVYIIIEQPSGEFISGPYSNRQLAERDYLKLITN